MCPKCKSKYYFSTLVDYIGRDENTCTCQSCGFQWKAYEQAELMKKFDKKEEIDNGK